MKYAQSQHIGDVLQKRRQLLLSVLLFLGLLVQLLLYIVQLHLQRRLLTCKAGMHGAALSVVVCIYGIIIIIYGIAVGLPCVCHVLGRLVQLSLHVVPFGSELRNLGSCIAPADRCLMLRILQRLLGIVICSLGRRVSTLRTVLGSFRILHSLFCGRHSGRCRTVQTCLIILLRSEIRNEALYLRLFLLQRLHLVLQILDQSLKTVDLTAVCIR